MAPSGDHFLHYTSGKEGTLSLALVLVNVVLVSGAILLYCSICKRKTAHIAKSRIERGRPHSELKKVTSLKESATKETKETNNGVIPSGAEKNRKSKKDKNKDAEPERNGSIVKDDDQVLLGLKNRVLPLPPPPPPDKDEDSEYDEIEYEDIPLEDEQNPPTAQPSVLQPHPGPNKKHLGDNSGSNHTVAVGGGVLNSEVLENINPLYISVEEELRNKTPENQESVIDLPSPGPNQGDQTMKEPMLSIPLANEPIYSVIRKDKPSIKKPPTIPVENLSIDLSVKIEVVQEKPNHSSAPVKPGVPSTSSFKLNTMVKNWKSRNLKTSTFQPTVSINVDLEDPPPIPDKLFDVGKEAESEEQHPNEDNTETDIKMAA